MVHSLPCMTRVHLAAVEDGVGRPLRRRLGLGRDLSRITSRLVFAHQSHVVSSRPASAVLAVAAVATRAREV